MAITSDKPRPYLAASNSVLLHIPPLTPLFFSLICQLEACEQGIRGFALHAAKFDMSFNRRQMVHKA